MDLPGGAPLTCYGRRTRTASGVVIGLAAVLLAGCSPGPVRVGPPGTEPAGTPLCAALHARLPAKVGDLDRRRTEPASDRTAAWGEPAVVLRCGVGVPEGYRPEVASVIEVNGVSWYQHIAGATIEWVVIDRAVYVELAVPRSYDGQGALLADLAGAITTALPKRPPG